MHPQDGAQESPEYQQNEVEGISLSITDLEVIVKEAGSPCRALSTTYFSEHLTHGMVL